MGRIHDDHEIEKMAMRFEELTEGPDPAVTRVDRLDDLRAIAEAADAVKASQARLREAVQIARRRGRSWNRIAIPLGVTRQAARSRFADEEEQDAQAMERRKTDA